MLRPKLLVANFISKIPKPTSGSSYRLKLVNGRRWRNAVNIDVSIQLGVFGYWPDRPDNEKVIRLAGSFDSLMQVRNDYILHFDLPWCDEDHALDETIEDWLAAGDPSQIRLYLSYTDGYSGVRRVDRHTFTSAQIEDRYFEAGKGIGRGRQVTDSDRAEHRGGK